MDAAYKFCGGGEGELPDEATLSRSMRVLIPPISDDQVFLSLAFLPSHGLYKQTEHFFL